MLIDQAKIYVFGGKGGDGCQSLYRDMYHHKGIPDGGDGGDGGNVVLKSDPNLSTLLDLRYNQHHKAGKGANGGSNQKTGRRGQDHIVRVPPGTLIKDADSDLIIRDLCYPGESVVVARGGKGGNGNSGKRTAHPGQEGEVRTLILELKMVADAGFIGFPNAGKSTLISRITKAHSKIAPYPFTTKSPKLGVVKFHDSSFVCADMPGLIEGAHKGKGLGDRFLRHIERTSVLVHMIDMVPVDQSDPAENFRKLEDELRSYDEKVFHKPRIIAGNKIDMPGGKEALESFRSGTGRDIIGISALTGEGIPDLVKTIYKQVAYVKEDNETNSGESRDEGPDR